MMKILTFQHKEVWEEIKKNGLYIAKRDSYYRSKTPKCYDIVFNNIKIREKGSTQPIFGWYAVLDKDNNKLVVNSKTVSRCMEMTGQDENAYLLFELEIDENRVSLQDFYTFVDARCEEERFDPYYDSFEEFPIKEVFNIGDGEVQCTISSIKLNDIRNIYSYKKATNGYFINKVV